jgi:hypothetical protein
LPPRGLPLSADHAELYHEYCYLKLYRRDYAIRIFGSDVFADDPWEKMKAQ